MLAITWCYSLFWAILPFINVGDYVREGYWVSCTFEYLNQSTSSKLYVGFLYCGAFALPVTVISACYTIIYVSIRRNNKKLMGFDRQELTSVECHSAPSGGSGCDAVGVASGTKTQQQKSNRCRRERWRLHKLEVQIARIAVILTLLFITSWTPYSTVALIGQYINPAYITSNPMLQLVSVFFAKCSAIWNPFVYAIMHTNFRSAIRVQILHCFHVFSRDESNNGFRRNRATLVTTVLWTNYNLLTCRVKIS